MEKRLKNLNYWQKTTVAALYDFIMAGFCSYLSLAIRFDSFFITQIPHQKTLFLYLFFLPCLQSICFYFSGLYARLWRYTSLFDLYAILAASLIAGSLNIIYVFVTMGTYGYPRSVLFLYFLAATRF